MQLLPAVGVLGLGRVGVLLVERRDVRVGLEVLGVDARRRGVEVALDAVLVGRLDRVEVDQRVVVEDRGVVARDEAHPAHVGRERVDVVDAAGRLEGLLAQAQVADLELVGVDRGVLGHLEVDAADPVAALLEVGHQVVADEAAGSGHEDSLHDPNSLRALRAYPLPRRGRPAAAPSGAV